MEFSIYYMKIRLDFFFEKNKPACPFIREVKSIRDASSSDFRKVVVLLEKKLVQEIFIYIPGYFFSGNYFNFLLFLDSKKNNFRGNYLWKYGSYQTTLIMLYKQHCTHQL